MASSIELSTTFIDEMMEPSACRVADVHAGTFTHVFQIGQVLQVFRRIVSIPGVSGWLIRFWLILIVHENPDQRNGISDAQSIDLADGET